MKITYNYNNINIFKFFNESYIYNIKKNININYVNYKIKNIMFSLIYIIMLVIWLIHNINNGLNAIVPIIFLVLSLLYIICILLSFIFSIISFKNNEKKLLNSTYEITFNKNELIDITNYDDSESKIIIPYKNIKHIIFGEYSIVIVTENDPLFYPITIKKELLENLKKVDLIEDNNNTIKYNYKNNNILKFHSEVKNYIINFKKVMKKDLVYENGYLSFLIKYLIMYIILDVFWLLISKNDVVSLSFIFVITFCSVVCMILLINYFVDYIKFKKNISNHKNTLTFKDDEMIDYVRENNGEYIYIIKYKNIKKVIIGKYSIIVCCNNNILYYPIEYKDSIISNLSKHINVTE